MKKILVFLVIGIWSLGYGNEVYNPMGGFVVTYTTIQEAVDAANPGDTIYVARGNYKINPFQFIQFT
ncbi:MAG: hypothetical protein V2A53_10485 [bacterium]